MDPLAVISSELGIPTTYMRTQNEWRNDRAIAVVHKEWLISLLTNNELPEFIYHCTLPAEEIQAWLHQKEELLKSWEKLFIQIVKKPGDNDLVLSLPRPRMPNSTSESGLSYAQLLHYISETNYKNLWKHFYKKYLGDKAQMKGKFNLRANLSNKNKEILQEVLKRYYGCQIVMGSNIPDDYHASPNRQMDFEPHSNILPALCIVEVKNYFLILHHIKNIITLKDCVTFSPMLLNSCYAKPLFIIYQLLQVMKDSHDRGLVLGNLQLDDIFLNDNLFIQVIPSIKDNIYKLSNEESESLKRNEADNSETFQKIKSYKKSNIPDFTHDQSSLHSMCFKWINGQISNFDYLMYLNRMAGRRFGDPSCHYIMPWVSDFATRSNGNWRDLSKSKFRLNKGDRQLDLTYENASNSSQTPHHVSDVLSEITYYVYLSRRTPRSLLCKYVRSVWVPAEYPSSIQRLQEWTPDECIPEFFYDPSIFKSVHEDLPDLELPPWALTPEEFIEAHREALESKYVSERLHHWIDLTFGYKLSGSAAVKSKNVCLHLVDSHTTLTTTGVVQLFSYPHPSKQTFIPFFEKVPPKLLLGSSSRKSRQAAPIVDKQGAGSEDEGHSSGNGEDDSFGAKNNSPLILSKLISRSKGSLLAPFQSPSYEETSRFDQTKSSSSSLTSTATASIILPKEYNPSALITSVETVHNFFKKTFLTEMESATTSEKNFKSNLKQIVASKRIQEMQVLGCVVAEIFLHNKLRVMDLSDLENRLKACLTFVSNDNLPRCVKSALNLLLQPFNQSYPFITSNGLPPPSAHQLLQPLLSSFMFPFPKLFSTIYSSVCTLMTSTKAINKCHLLNINCEELCDSLNELKIKKFSIDLDKVWDDILSSKNDQLIDIIFPFVKELFDNPTTSKLSVVLLLDKVTRDLGPRQTNELLLDTILNLYNSNSYDSNDNLYLYHKNFLLILIVRCGLKVFLENFIGPLVEAVGRYKDSPVTEKWSTKSHTEPNETENCLEMTLSPLDEDSSPDVEKQKNNKPEKEVEVFAFDKDDTPSCGESDEAVRRAVEHLDLNLISDLDQLSQDEGDVSPCVTHGGVRSPDIAIPVMSSSSRQNLLTSIECNIGSKSSDSRSSSFKIDDKKSKTDFEDHEGNNLGNESVHLKASDVAGDSIVWLAHRLGPVLTSRHIIRNLLRMLSVCYIGKDNLEPFVFTEADESNLWKLSIAKWKVTGDENAETVLRTLGEIAELYGEQIILLQYLPFMSDLISISKRKFTVSLEGGVIGCLSLLKYIVPFMNDTTLMDQLQDVILKSIIHPAVRLVSSTRFSFPSGQRGRYTLVTKLVDTMYLISLRIGAEMTKVHLAVPSLQRFFLAFDKAHGVKSHLLSNSYDERNIPDSNTPLSKSTDESSRYLEIQRDGSTTEWTVRGVPGQPISIAHVRSHKSLESSAPVGADQQDETKNKAVNELKAVFNAQLAHLTYLPFYRFLGEATMENTLKNQNLIRDLCFQYEQVQSVNSQRDGVAKHAYLSDYLSAQDYITEKGGSGSFGSNVAVIGNKIELQSVDVPVFSSNINGISDSEIVLLVSRKMEDSSRHLRGNWLAYWEHEIGRSDKDNKFNFKQIKLQSFNGHTNSVRMIHCLDNENSFMSGSKDKTVKLWSLRSQGDGSSTNNCQFTYSHHRKSLLSLSFVHSVRIVASCDSTIHLWDPFEGKTISVMDNARVAPINVLKPLNPPSCNLIAATTEATLKIIDARLCSYVSEYKVSVLNSVGLIRSICVSPNGNWVAVGQASGLLTVLDVRTGMVLASWKGHEAEVLQLAAINDNILLSSSLDQTVSAWNVSDGKFKFHMKGPAEPVHCLTVYNNELITGTTANRIGVHTSIDSQSSFSSTKLRSDAFKGILTSMTVLPLNKLLLLGADNGNINLLC